MTKILERIRRRLAKRGAFNRWADKASSMVGGLEGKRVLEVGCDVQGSLAKYISEQYEPTEMVGLNLSAKNRQLSASCRLETGDIRKAPYSDDYFDAIVSTSAFEHIQDFEVALQEMYRVLKPGGFLYSQFGPIWSTSYGHHLWLKHQGQIYNYWNVVLPPFCHLLMTEEEVSKHLRKHHEQNTADAISHYVFCSDEQNHLFFEDYEAKIRDSSFEVIILKGYDHPELSQMYNRMATADTYRALYERLPGYRNFSYDGIELLMCKPASEG